MYFFLYRFRYNLLALIQAAIGSANVLLLYTVYGLSDSTSVFLIVMSVIGSFQLLIAMAYEQFIFHYIKIRVVEPERAETIFVGMLAITSTLGFGSAAIVFFFAEYIVDIFVGGLLGERLTLAIDLIKIMSWSLLFGSVLLLTQARINGLGKIGWSSTLAISSQLLQFCVLLYAYLHPITVHLAALSQPIGQALSSIVGLLLFRPVFNRSLYSSTHLQRIVKDSFHIRAAHNIHNFFSLYFVNSTLSLLPTQFASVYILMKRIVDTLLTVITGPIQKVVTNEVGAAMHSGAYAQVRARLSSLDFQLPAVFGTLLVVGWAVGFAFSIGQWVNSDELRYGLICFTVLIIQSTLIATEIPYALVSLSLHNSKVFYLSNTIFLAALVSALFFLKDISPSLALPFSLAFAQVFNFFIIRHAANIVLKMPRVSK